jgi:small subunit ribosomal protein S2
MSKLSTQELLDAGVHYGHLTRKWNPKMAPFIFMEQNGIHIIDLNKTVAKLAEAQGAVKNIIKSGRKILFVATKKQAKELVAEEARKVNMPYVTERWLGGMLTNFATVRKSIKKMQEREKVKLQRVLGGIEDLNRLPAALFIIDIKREHIAVAEAQKLNIPIFALVDTNSDPTLVDHPIPGNDDASKSIELITTAITQAIVDGLQERKKAKDERKDDTVEETTVEIVEAAN